jgi:hypothetical protein
MATSGSSNSGLVLMSVKLHPEITRLLNLTLTYAILDEDESLFMKHN